MPENSTSTEDAAALQDVADYMQQLQDHIDQVKRDRLQQPARLAEARAAAQTAKDLELVEHPFEPFEKSVMSYTHNQVTGESLPSGMLSFPSLAGKELFGARLAFDMAMWCHDPDKLQDVLSEYLTIAQEPEAMMLLATAALRTMAEHVVAVVLDELERRGGDHTMRVNLADAARNAWATRP